MSPRGWLWAGVVALVLGIGIAAAVVGSGPDVEDPASTDPAATYRVAYRVETISGADPVRRTEVVEVRRPYDQRIEVSDGDGRTSSVTVTNRDHFWSFGEDENVQLATVRVPAGLGRDVSAVTLAAAVDRGIATSEGAAEVAGEACRRYAYRESADGALAAPTPDDRIVSCVTPDGILLREEWRSGENLVRLREATEVDRSPELSDEDFLVDRDPPEGEASRLFASQQGVAEDRVPMEDPLSPDLPQGFRRDRVAAVNTSGGSLPSLSLVETFRRGDELVVVTQGTEELGPPPWDPGEGHPVDGEGDARIVYRIEGVEVRVSPGDRWVRVTAGSPEVALRVVRSLGG